MIFLFFHNNNQLANKDYAFILESTMNEYFNQRRPCTTVKVCSASIDLGAWLQIHVQEIDASDYLTLHKKVCF